MLAKIGSTLQNKVDLHFYIISNLQWRGSAQDLATFVREFFIVLVKTAANRGIAIAIVTFSPQVDLIRRVLKDKFPDFADEIQIRGSDDSWFREGKRGGKQEYMCSAANEINRIRESNQSDQQLPRILRKSTLLLDDDIVNIRFALKDGVRAILFEPDNIQSTIFALLELE